MEKEYLNFILISITDKFGNPHADNWRDKYLGHTGDIQFRKDYWYPDETRLFFSSHQGGGLIASPGKKIIEENKITVMTTNSIYTFERADKNEGNTTDNSIGNY